MKFQQCKGNRLKSRFYAIKVINSDKKWWTGKETGWMNSIDIKSSPIFNKTEDGNYQSNSLIDFISNFCKCTSYKAFRRHLRKYGEKGTLYRLVSNFTGYDIEAFGRNYNIDEDDREKYFELLEKPCINCGCRDSTSTTQSGYVCLVGGSNINNSCSNFISKTIKGVTHES